MSALLDSTPVTHMPLVPILQAHIPALVSLDTLETELIVWMKMNAAQEITIVI